MANDDDDAVTDEAEAEAEAEPDVKIDKIISQLLNWTASKEKKEVPLELQDIEYLCQRSSEIFLREPCLLELEGPLPIAGSLGLHLNQSTHPHSSYLIRILILYK